MRKKNVCKCCVECNQEPGYIEVCEIHEPGNVSEMLERIKVLKAHIDELADQIEGKESDELREITSRIDEHRERVEEFMRSKEEEDDEFFYDDDNEVPDMDRIGAAAQERQDILEELCDDPDFQEYLENTNEWMKLNSKKNDLLQKLNLVKGKQNRLLKKCREYEDKIARDGSIARLMARISKLAKK